MYEKAFLALQKAPLMDGVSAGFIRRCAETGRLRSLNGRYGRISREELSQRLFFIISGEMRTVQMSPDGQECLMERLGAGEFICLASVVSGHSCHSELVSSGTTEVICWGHDHFRELMYEDTAFSANLLYQMASQIEREREMRTLSRCCKADVKVAAYLLHKIRQGPCCRQCHLNVVDLRPISLTAQELGVARETFSRSLQRLVAREIISYERGLVTVADLSPLEEVLEENGCACHSH